MEEFNVFIIVILQGQDFFMGGQATHSAGQILCISDTNMEN
jgi:hypothetical protein